MGEKRRHFLATECQWINAEEMIELEKHHTFKNQENLKRSMLFTQSQWNLSRKFLWNTKGQRVSSLWRPAMGPTLTKGWTLVSPSGGKSTQCASGSGSRDSHHFCSVPARSTGSEWQEETPHKPDTGTLINNQPELFKRCQSQKI